MQDSRRGDRPQNGVAGDSGLNPGFVTCAAQQSAMFPGPLPQSGASTMKKKSTKADAAKAVKGAKTPARKTKAKPSRLVDPKRDKPNVESPREKRIRGSFSMPERDYALIAELKSLSKHRGRPVKKNELLRAGLQALKAMNADALQAALAGLRPSPATPARKAK
ncbi:MAG: hypothetical protein H7Y19_00310 [Luteimonas sp.]|nr:hypothetical protein [Luteimonas sp.]